MSATPKNDSIQALNSPAIMSEFEIIAPALERSFTVVGHSNEHQLADLSESTKSLGHKSGTIVTILRRLTRLIESFSPPMQDTFLTKSPFDENGYTCGEDLFRKTLQKFEHHDFQKPQHDCEYFLLNVLRRTDCPNYEQLFFQFFNTVKVDGTDYQILVHIVQGDNSLTFHTWVASFYFAYGKYLIENNKYGHAVSILLSCLDHMIEAELDRSFRPRELLSEAIAELERSTLDWTLGERFEKAQSLFSLPLQSENNVSLERIQQFFGGKNLALVPDSSSISDDQTSTTKSHKFGVTYPESSIVTGVDLSEFMIP
jgi:hypothetical protein